MATSAAATAVATTTAPLGSTSATTAPPPHSSLMSALCPRRGLVPSHADADDARQTARERVRRHAARVLETVYGRDTINFVQSSISFFSICFVLLAFATIIVAVRGEFGFCDGQVEYFLIALVCAFVLEWFSGFLPLLRDHAFGESARHPYLVRLRREQADAARYVAVETIKLGVEVWGVAATSQGLAVCGGDYAIDYVAILGLALAGIALQCAIWTYHLMFLRVLYMLRTGALVTAQDVQSEVVATFAVAAPGHEPCPICFDDDPNKSARVTPCGHCFDETCLRNWLAVSRTCPVCRTALVPDRVAPASGVPVVVVVARQRAVRSAPAASLGSVGAVRHSGDVEAAGGSADAPESASDRVAPDIA